MEKKQKFEMTLTATLDRRVVVQLPYDATIEDFLDACKTLAIGLTYAPETWERGIRELAENYKWNDPSSHYNNDE
jgi:hypothetical protein